MLTWFYMLYLAWKCSYYIPHMLHMTTLSCFSTHFATYVYIVSKSSNELTTNAFLETYILVDGKLIQSERKYCEDTRLLNFEIDVLRAKLRIKHCIIKSL